MVTKGGDVNARFFGRGEDRLERQHELGIGRLAVLVIGRLADADDIADAGAVFRGIQGRVKYAEAFTPLRLFINI